MFKWFLVGCLWKNMKKDGMFGFGGARNGTRAKRWKRREGEGKEETLTDKPGDFDNHARQRTGRLIGSASRTLITCVGQRFVSYWAVVTRLLLFILVGKICPFWLSFPFSPGQTENPVHRSFFPPKPNGNACYARYQNLRFSPLNRMY